MTELDEAMVEKVARAIAEASGIEICADASYRHSTFGPKARAALTTILPDLREQHYAKCTAGIVAWLKDQWDRGELVCGDELADAIERRDHITKEGE